MPRSAWSRSALTLAVILGAVTASQSNGQLPPERFWPLSTLDRFKPEALPALESPAYFGDFEKAKQLLHFGRYRKALYASFTMADVEPVDVALLRGEAYWRIGERALAVQTLSPFDADPRAGVLLARIDLTSGDAAAAVGRLVPLVEAEPNAIAPRHWLAMAHEAIGDLESALKLHAFFAEGSQNVLERYRSEGPIAFEVAEDLTLAAKSVDRWATLSMQYKADRDLHETVLAMFVAAYDVVDRDYWPARVEAARYLLAHGNKKAATDELEAANQASPNAVEVNELMGQMAYEAQNEAGVAEAVRSIRAVDVMNLRADLLEVRLHLIRREFARARAFADTCVSLYPQDLEVLSTLAAAQWALGDEAATTETLARIDQLDPDNAASRVSVAEVAGGLFYDAPAAIRWLEEAVDRAPWWTEPQHRLGAELLKEGDENRARVVLDQAYALDPYNLVTVNYLRVLDQMMKFQEFESERFIFRYDGRDDPIIPMYVAPRMDAMYDELKKDFRYEPAKKPIVEVFPDAQSFSVRTAGIPGFETYGASLGRVMTTVAPRAGRTLGPFNWNRVLRHEFTHTMNLLYTRGRVPRWLTEGIAVWQEKVPYRFANVPEQLYKLAVNGKMPGPGDMRVVKSEMHYMSAFWIVRYIDETQGWDHVLTLLDGYRAGKEEGDVFLDATGMDLATFEQKFGEWAKEQVSTWGYDEKTQADVKILQKEAERLTDERLFKEATAKWQEIAKLQPMNALPPRRLAGIYLAQNQPDDALPHLIATLPIELADNRFAKRIARIFDAVNDPPNAMKYALFALDIDPYDPDAHDLLSSLHEKAGDVAKAKQEAEVAKLLRARAERE
jgi:cellulose synthase operon protein C